MDNREDSKWEVVDELPGEGKRKPTRRPTKSKLPKKTIFWTGLAVGCVAAILARPLWGFFGNLFRNVIAYWWLGLLYLAYWYWMKTKAARKR